MNVSVENSTVDWGKSIGGHEAFDPVPYTFRIPEKWKRAEESSVLSPPNWLLLDHTIAVVWYLFSSFTPGKVLDIDDLKWAHEYLKEVRNARGENPPDVKTCLTEIQDRLIAEYAQLTRKESSSIKKGDPSTAEVEPILVVKPAKTSSITVTEEVPKVVEVATAVAPAVTTTTKREGKTGKDTVRAEANTKRKATARETAVAKKGAVGQQKRLAGAVQKSTQIAPKRNDPVRRGKDGDTPVENFFTEVFQRNKNDRILGSHNMTRAKGSGTRTRTLSNEDISGCDVKNDSIQSRSDDGKISLQFKKWITAEETNQNEEQAYRNLKNEIRNLTKNPKISKDEVLKFLSNWREEQVERLQSELKRLNSIEEFMKSFKMEGFVPYVPQDLTQKLEEITYKKKLVEQS